MQAVELDAERVFRRHYSEINCFLRRRQRQRRRGRGAVARGAELVFTEIEAGNDRSLTVHERLGFTRVGSRQVFVLA
jgi:hypothetical protein